MSSVLLAAPGETFSGSMIGVVLMQVPSREEPTSLLAAATQPGSRRWEGTLLLATREFQENDVLFANVNLTDSRATSRTDLDSMSTLIPS